MVAAMASLVMWLGRLQGRKAVFTLALHCGKHQAQTFWSYLSLAEEVIRHEPGK